MFNLLIQLIIEEVLSGGKAYLASHPELGVPLGIFNDKHEPNYEARVRNIKTIGYQGSKRSLLLAQVYGIKNPLPSFDLADDYKKSQKALAESLAMNEKLRDSATQYNDELKETPKAWDSITNKMKEANNVLLTYRNMVTNTAQKMAMFTVNTHKQYEISEKIASSYKTAALNLGLNVSQGKLLQETFKAASPLVMRYGGNVKDLEEIYTALGDASGRIQFLTKTELENVFMMTAALKMSEQDAAAMADRFQLMGVNIERMYTTLQDTVKESRSIGLNSQKVIATLEQNFASMQRMSFRGGVKAMTDMAKLAVEMRMDIGEMLGMADKFYEPEAAIEAAAELQLMGGDIAAAFGDPFEVMYLARNKPEELARKVAEMTENMMIFNKETGEYELPPEAKQQLTFMADKLGIAKDNIIDTAYQANKLKDVKEALSGAGSWMDDDEKSAIAQMAKFDKKKGWVVTMGDEDFGIENLEESMVNALLAGPTKEEEAEPLKAMVNESFITNQLLENILEEFRYGLSIETDFYEVGERLLSDSVAEIGKGSAILIEEMKKQVDLSKTGKSPNLALKVLDPKVQADIGTALGNTVKKSFEFSKKIITDGVGAATDGLVEDLKDITTWFGNLNDQLKEGGTGGNTIPNQTTGHIDGSGNYIPLKQDFISRPGGDITPFTSEDTVMGFKPDGPLSKMMQGGGSEIKVAPISINGDLTVNVKTPTGSATGQIANNELAEALLPHLKSLILNKLGHGDIFSGGKPVTSTTFPDEF